MFSVFFFFFSQIEFWEQLLFFIHFRLSNKFFSLKNRKLFLETENKRKKQLPNTPLYFLKNNIYIYIYILNLKEILVIFYFHNCYVHMKSLFIWKYINFKNYYNYIAIMGYNTFKEEYVFVILMNNYWNYYS